MAQVDLLNKSFDMLDRMELDLAERARDVLRQEGVNASVSGVFSIEDMEKMRESDVCASGAIAVGVGYSGAVARPKGQGNVDNATARAEMVDFMFSIVLAVPGGENCEMRFDAGRVLSALRLGIMGRGPAEKHPNMQSVARTWEFVQEGPNVRESSTELMYYSQAWRLSLPQTSQKR